MALRRTTREKRIEWPEGLDRFDLESLFIWGPGIVSVSLVPPGWTMADAEAAWHALGAEVEVEPSVAAEDFWALKEWGKPRGAPASR